MRTLSAVVPHHGDPVPTLELVVMLQGQSCPPTQIIVVDDCSPVPFPQTPGVRVVRREVNGGFGSAVNSGLALVETEAALVLNSDLQVPPTFVADLVAAATPWWPAVVSPQVLGHAGDSQWVGRRFPTVTHQVVEWLTPLARFRPWLHAWVGHDPRCVTGETVVVDWVMGAAMLLPVPQVRSVGGFDEGYFMNSEEVDLQRRLAGVGVRSVFAGTVLVTHEGGGSSDPARRRQWLVDSRMRFARIWGGRRRLRLGLTAASVINFVVNLIRQLGGREVDARATLRAELGLLRRSREQ